MYDQIYSLLTFGETQHFDPVSLRPEMRNYTVFVDGISKSLAATGVRVGWGFGPAFIIDKMKSILGHVGAWAPRPEQVASGRYLSNHDQVDSYLTWIKAELENRLHGFYNGFQQLKKKGYAVRAIPPAAAIYLTVQFDLVGKKTAEGKVLEHTGDITSYILNEAKVALVPFRAFGASNESTWYRLSVGTASMNDVNDTIEALDKALSKLS
jgi:aspartate aminotransferase